MPIYPTNRGADVQGKIWSEVWRRDSADQRMSDNLTSSRLPGSRVRSSTLSMNTPRTAAFEYQLLFSTHGDAIPKVTRHILAIVSVDFGGDGDSPSGTGLWFFNPANPTTGAISTRFNAGFFILSVVLIVQLQDVRSHTTCTAYN